MDSELNIIISNIYILRWTSVAISTIFAVALSILRDRNLGKLGDCHIIHFSQQDVYISGPSGFCSLCPRDRRSPPPDARRTCPRRAARPSLSASVCALLGLRSAVRRSKARSSCLCILCPSPAAAMTPIGRPSVIPNSRPRRRT